jgi:hypothetical protein
LDKREGEGETRVGISKVMVRVRAIVRMKERERV